MMIIRPKSIEKNNPKASYWGNKKEIREFKYWYFHTRNRMIFIERMLKFHNYKSNRNNLYHEIEKPDAPKLWRMVDFFFIDDKKDFSAILSFASKPKSN